MCVWERDRHPDTWTHTQTYTHISGKTQWLPGWGTEMHMCHPRVICPAGGLKYKQSRVPTLDWHATLPRASGQSDAIYFTLIFIILEFRANYLTSLNIKLSPLTFSQPKSLSKFYPLLSSLHYMSSESSWALLKSECGRLLPISALCYYNLHTHIAWSPPLPWALKPWREETAARFRLNTMWLLSVA